MFGERLGKKPQIVGDVRVGDRGAQPLLRIPGRDRAGVRQPEEEIGESGFFETMMTGDFSAGYWARHVNERAGRCTPGF